MKKGLHDMTLTKDELRTLLWMAQNQYASRALQVTRKGQKPSDDPVIQRLLSISRKVNAELVEQTNNNTEKTYYRVWLQNEDFDSFPLFDRISAEELETWLHENAEASNDFGKTVWWIEHYRTDSIRDDIPYSSMGYIVKYEKI